MENQVEVYIPSQLSFGRSTEELQKITEKGLVLLAYLEKRISLMRAGEILNMTYQEVCDLFYELEIPTIRKMSPQLEGVREKNRQLLENQLGRPS